LPHPEAIFPDRLYMADPDYLLSLLRGALADRDAAGGLGHNPGLEEFAALLAATAPMPTALGRMRKNSPPRRWPGSSSEGEWRESGPGRREADPFRAAEGPQPS
jgi:phosphohistidine phosphatase